LDKIFGYDNFVNEIVWYYYNKLHDSRKQLLPRAHDIVFRYSKSPGNQTHTALKEKRDQPVKKLKYHKVNGQIQNIIGEDGKAVTYTSEDRTIDDVWRIRCLQPANKQERIGYPTQKPEDFLERVIVMSSNEGDIVADFFMGGGTTCAVAQKLNRRFIGCDISRVAASVALNRLIKDAEEISGRTASVNINKPKKKNEQLGLEMTIKPIPDIHVYYMGVYPIEKFQYIEQKQFEDFILTCYGSSRFTGEGKITGVMNAGTSLLIGSVKPNESLSEADLKKFVEDVLKLRYQENIRLRLKVVAWVFPPGLQKYAQVLENYFYKKNVPVDIELIPINTQLFRKRILDHYPDASKSEFLLKFISQASIMDIACKKLSSLTYAFEAVGARSNNLDGYLINCQWDFNFAQGRFGDSEYALMREQKNGRYVAVLKAEKEFERPGKYIVACRVQDNLGGEAIKTKEFEIDG